MVTDNRDIDCHLCDDTKMEREGFDKSGHWVVYKCPNCNSTRLCSTAGKNNGMSVDDLNNITQFNDDERES